MKLESVSGIIGENIYGIPKRNISKKNKRKCLIIVLCRGVGGGREIISLVSPLGDSAVRFILGWEHQVPETKVC